MEKLKALIKENAEKLIYVKEIFILVSKIKMILLVAGINVLPAHMEMAENILNVICLIGVAVGILKYNPDVDGRLLNVDKAIQFIADIVRMLIKKK